MVPAATAFIGLFQVPFIKAVTTFMGLCQVPFISKSVSDTELNLPPLVLMVEIVLTCGVDELVGDMQHGVVDVH